MEERKTALITGGAGGIGLELAKILALQGNDLILVDIREKELIEAKTMLEKEYQCKVKTIAKDLTAPDSIQNIYDEIKMDGIKVGMLINNAGLGDFGEFHLTNWAKQETILKLNIFALTHLTRLFLPDMMENKEGKILNVASLAAFQPSPLMSMYFASKAFVLSFSEAVANEVKGSGVSVTVFCPGPTLTGFQQAVGAGSPELSGKNWIYADVKDVAKAAYKAMMSKKPVVIHGWFNYILAHLPRLLPRNVVTQLTRSTQERNRKKRLQQQKLNNS